jgi:hypothetical protein
MALAEELERIAGIAAAHGQVSGVLAAEPAAGRRAYLVSFGDGDERRWALLDDAGAIVERREDVRDAASIVAMCELAAELAGERVAGVPPRVASPAYLDEVGAAAIAAERERGELSSPYSEAIRAGTGAVNAFVEDVERGYLVDLR